MYLKMLLMGLMAQQIYASCHPSLDLKQSQYVIGYGSLMFDPSKRKSLDKCGPNQPIELSGYRRSWLVRGEFLGRPTTFLGVKPDTQAKINAVVFEVFHSQGMKRLDAREKGYCRYLVERQQIKFLHGHHPKQAQYWIYVPQNKVSYFANQEHPMSLYYADIFLTGCQVLEQKFGLKDFTQQCFTTSDHWPLFANAYYPTDRLSVNKHLVLKFYAPKMVKDHRLHGVDA